MSEAFIESSQGHVGAAVHQPLGSFHQDVAALERGIRLPSHGAAAGRLEPAREQLVQRLEVGGVHAHDQRRAVGNQRKGAPREVRDQRRVGRDLALQQVPDANVTWTEEAMLRHKSSDVGVAVAVEGGLVTPVIRHAELKSLSEISDELAALAERARRRRLAPHEYQGGATAISNLGMMGVRDFDAVINPPHATILAVGAAEQRPVVVDGRIEVGTVMSCSLSCDHRAVDGATGADLLAAFKALIEDPLRMLV